MKFSITRSAVAGACVLSLLAVSPVFAAGTDAHDNVISHGGDTVRSTSGACVRTKWQKQSDPCAVKLPEPKVVAAPAPPPPPAPKVALEQRTVYFDFNKTALTAEAVEKLDNLVSIVKQSQAIRQVTVLGYADEIGTASYNLALSQKRAAMVEQYLASRISIPTNVLMVNGKGATDSKTDCPKTLKRQERITCLAQDRRVEVEFNYLQ